jgi:hypothetical protein
MSKTQVSTEGLTLVKKQRSYLFTSESVTEGHPDKVADQISDAVLDAIISKDPNARVDVETVIIRYDSTDRSQRSSRHRVP